MTEYMYHDYVKTLSKRFEANLTSIEVGQNFEYGPEFEIAICNTLRSALPDKYGIARGYVVNAEGTRAGDDIVIFERSRFPTLALRGRDDYARKEFIPIEAVYAYIEAKHTLNLDGEDDQSLQRALDQVGEVKQLCSEREEITSEGLLGPYKDSQVRRFLHLRASLLYKTQCSERFLLAVSGVQEENQFSKMRARFSRRL
jgi:hypothetical protein